MHGVFSWVDHDTRDALLALCAEVMSANGLLYLCYNAKPGWAVRGLIREFLREQTADISGVMPRAGRARELSAALAERLRPGSHPFTQLLAMEFQFVLQNPVSHTAHEYLAEHNHAYGRAEFDKLIEGQRLVYVASTDPSDTAEPVPSDFFAGLGIAKHESATLDLLKYRQMSSVILAGVGFEPGGLTSSERLTLMLTSELVPDPETGAQFTHPNGTVVTVRNASLAKALARARASRPDGQLLRDLLSDLDQVWDDLVLLDRYRLIELTLPGSRGLRP